MKAIQSIHLKRNAPNATLITVQIIFDNLNNMCNTYWVLLSEDKIQIDSGNLTIKDDDYTNWDGNNDYPYQFVANELGVTIIGDYYGTALGAQNI